MTTESTLLNPRQILAHYDDEGVFVYQAFKPTIVQHALEAGTFSKGFNMERMTWIKPSFGWMLYRSGYASKRRQEAIVRIKICHEGFLQILEQAILTSYEPTLHETEREWKRELNHSDVRVQWDPDRSLRLHKLEHRAIQIGIRGKTVHHYVHDWIIGLEEVTQLARELKDAVKSKSTRLPEVPEETVYDVPDHIAARLLMIS